MAEDIKKILEKHRNEIRGEISVLKTDVKRHFDVVAEDLLEQVKAVAEGVSTNTRQIDALTEQVAGNTEAIETMKVDVSVLKADMKIVKTDMRVMQTDIDTMKTDMDIMKTDMGVMKTDMELIKYGLKRKVDVEEFAVLEHRVSALESRAARG